MIEGSPHRRVTGAQIEGAVKRPRSSWTVRVYESTGTLLNVPSMYAMRYLGSTTIPYINFQGTETLRKVSAPPCRPAHACVRLVAWLTLLQYFAGVPASNFAVEFYGNILVQNGGTYDFCTASSDGYGLAPATDV